jgi:hypothetical protein
MQPRIISGPTAAIMIGGGGMCSGPGLNSGVINENW